MEWSQQDYPRGMLTQKDRDYLRDGELPDSRQARYERKKGTRKRIRATVLDFPFLWNMNQNERRKLFRETYETSRAKREFYDALQSMISFVYWAVDNDPEISKPFEVLETIYRHGIEAAMDGNELIVPTIDRIPNPEAIYTRFQNGEDISEMEIAILARSGTLTEDDLDELEDPLALDQTVGDPFESLPPGYVASTFANPKSISPEEFEER